MFDVYFLGENKKLLEHIPFAEPVPDIEKIKPNTKMYWVVEPNIEILDYDIFNFRPENYDQKYEHIWKWDQNNYGGIRLIPKRSHGKKEINKVICKKKFDILFTDKPNDYFENNPYATHVWCVDPEYKLADDINWAPNNFEPDFIHSFHLRGQLEYKYPELEGGIKLYPREWQDATIKYHTFLDASATYPVLYVKDVVNYGARDSFTDDYVWLVDQDHVIEESTLDWVPNPFENTFVHVFRMPYQLTEKYPMAMGGIRLVPKNWQKAETKIHPACPVEDANYDVFYVDEDEFTPDTYTEYAQRSRTDWFWMVDRDFDFNGKLLYVASKHEQEYIHVFKIPGHLDFRYPADNTDPWDNRCGGVRLVHKNFDYTKHKYQAGVVPVRYDIFYTDSPSNFESIIKKSRTKMFWCIDSEHTISNALKYVPSRDEQKYLLNFKIADQLTHKYPYEQGGVFLVPRSYNENTSVKYKGNFSVKKKEYPVLFVDDVTDLSVISEDCWLIDREYQIDNDIDWSPNSFEMQCIHTFKIPNQLKHKYPDTMGGVRWVPKDWNGEYVIHEDLPVKTKTYKVILVDDPNDYSQAEGECWLIDREYQLTESIEWIPSNFEREFIHTFHVEGQLEHKYPKEMGGVRWVPANWENAEIKIHTETPFAKPEFERYESEEEGRKHTTKDWFWVVEPTVQVNIEFDFSYVPTVWDANKTHMWQKLNPITGKQYDYGGVMLCPKQEQTKGRPKYIREPACTEIQYPVLQLTNKKSILDQLIFQDMHTTTNMFWAIDPDVKINEDFEFDYYPTQWDRNTVHVFSDSEGQHRGVRLYPKNTFIDNSYTLEQISNNSFEKLKLLTNSACIASEWPVEKFTEMTVVELKAILERHAGVSYVWTVDVDVREDENLIKDSFTPKLDDKDRVHVWQRADADNNIISHGGLRLWPTNFFTEKSLTDDQLITCTIDDQLILDGIGSVQKTYPVYYLEPDDVADQLQRIDAGCDSNMFWCVDPYVKLAEGFLFDYVPNKWEETYVHVFKDFTDTHRGVRLFPKGTFAESVDLKQIANNSFENMKFVDTVATQQEIWPLHIFTQDAPLKQQLSQFGSTPFYTLDDDVDLHPDVAMDYVPEINVTDKIHSWQKMNPHTDKIHAYGGLRLWTNIPEDLTSDDIQLNRFKNHQFVKQPGTVNIPYGIVMLSYKEQYAETSYERLRARFENVVWVRDVEGIFAAHKAAAQQIDTKMFWVVDADADIADDFDFSYIPDQYDQEVVHVWSALNPVTGLEYGYGGVKLFNTKQVLNATSWGLDFTTGLSTRFKAMPELSCVTRFNTDPYSTWRSAFRESVKLTLKDDAESAERLQAWLHPVPDASFRHDAKQGAEAGNHYAKLYVNSSEDLGKINDFAWLKEYYENN